MRKSIRGVTLIELMVVVAILAILMMLAVPSIDAWRNKSRLSSYSNLLVTSLNYAKSEAISRGVRVTVCRSADPEAAAPVCTGASDWSTGWIVFVDDIQAAGNTAGVFDAGSDILLKRISSTLGATMTADANYTNWVSFLPSGLSRGSGTAADGNFALCSTATKDGVTITVNVVGRVTATRRVCP